MCSLIVGRCSTSTISGASLLWSQKLHKSASSLFHSKIASSYPSKISGRSKYSLSSKHNCSSLSRFSEQIQIPSVFINKVKLSVGPPERENSNQDIDSQARLSGATMSAPKYIVGHDQTGNNFYIVLDETNTGPTAKLEYNLIRPNLVDMYHTEVPPQFQGQGIAKILAKAAFDYFSEKEITMRPTCTYLQKYLRDNPYANYLDHVEREYAEKIKAK